VNPFDGPTISPELEKVEYKIENRAIGEHNRRVKQHYEEEIEFRETLKEDIIQYSKLNNKTDKKGLLVKISKHIFQKLPSYIQKANDENSVFSLLNKIFSKYNNLQPDNKRKKCIKEISDVFFCNDDSIIKNEVNLNDDIELVNFEGKFFMNTVTDKYKKLKNLTSSFDNDWDNDKKEVYRNQLIKIIGDPRDSIISLSREEQDLIDKMIKFYNLKTPAEILSSPTHKTLKRS